MESLRAIRQRIFKAKLFHYASPSQPWSSEAAALSKSDNSGKFGLFSLSELIYSDHSESVPISAETQRVSQCVATESHHADIIAIHGLGGTAFATWTHDNGSLWLRDFVCEEFPTVSVYTFGYDSGFTFSTGSGTLRDFARALLESIKLERTTQKRMSRPIIFVCHSMGGIVAKQAIVIARNESKLYPGIADAVSGILFLGTPHQGSLFAQYATVLARAANAVIIGSQVSRLTGPIRTELLASLKRQEPELLKIAEDFRPYTTHIKIFSFIEGKPVRGMNERIVDDHSAFLGAATERKIPMPGYDHRELCRHGSREDLGAKLLLGAIRECLNISDHSNIKSEVTTNVCLPCSYIPFKRNSNFAGQQHILEQLGSLLDDASGINEAALYGLGGIGKSQVALQFAYTSQDKTPELSVFWVFAGTKERFEYDYLKIAQSLKLPGHDDLEVDILTLVKNSLEQPTIRRWLMVIDNADDLTSFYETSSPHLEEGSTGPSPRHHLSNFIPHSTMGFVLYTTRNKVDASRLTSEGRIFQITEMPPADMISILRNKFGEELIQGNGWLELVEVMECLPLAVIQATSYIRQNSCSVSRYLSYFKGRDKDITNRLLLHDFHDKTREQAVANSVFQTWTITVQHLESHFPRAAELLWKMVFYNRQNIPRFLLLTPIDTKNSATHYSCESRSHHVRENNSEARELLEYYMDEAVGVLRAYSFITTVFDGQEEGYSLHRLVQMFSLYWIKHHEDKWNHWQAEALHSLLQVFPETEFDDWAKSAQLLPHIHGFTDPSAVSSLPPLELGMLLNSVSTYMRKKGQYSLAKQYIRIGFKSLCASVGVEHPATIEASGRLALSYREEGNLDEAEKLLRTAIDSSIKILGDKHAKTFQAKMNLGTVLRGQQKYDEAINLARECVSGLEKINGVEAEDTLNAQMSLATSLGSAGHYDEALAIQKVLAQKLRNVYTDGHPRLLNLLHDLAVTLTRHGDLADAWALSQHVLELNTMVYGSAHPRTINIEFNLALILSEKQEYSQAEIHFRRVLEYREQNSDGEDGDRVMALRSLSLCLAKQEKFDEANTYLRMALHRQRNNASNNSPESRLMLNIILEDSHKIMELQHAVQRNLLQTKLRELEPLEAMYPKDANCVIM